MKPLYATRPDWALWLKLQWRWLRFIPWLGNHLWQYADLRVEAWHAEMAWERKAAYTPVRQDAPGPEENKEKK